MVATARPLNILVLACFNTGDRFLQRARERGARVWVLTKETYLRKKPWRRDLLEDIFAEPDDTPLSGTMNTVSYLARGIRFDRIIPFDDVEVDAAARLREHLQIPGMGESQARLFRDKLAMRVKARAEGIPVPAFVGLLHHAEIHAFTSEVPAPWMLKPRTEASSTGIRKIHTPEQLWKEIEALGDRASHFLLERYLPGAVHHVDSIVIDGEVVFSEVHRNGIPPFDVSHGGGVFSTFTVERGSPDEQALQELNRKVLERFGLRRGVTHLEYIQGSEDGRMYFLEAGARVGGAHVADVVEAATGINLWAELADIEIDRDAAPYRLPPRRAEYGGLVQSLARSERPDLSAYNDPEVTGTIEDRYHAGIVVRSPEPRRVRELLDAYARRFAHDFLAVMPHYELPPQR
jgi:biotin carboxylase